MEKIKYSSLANLGEDFHRAFESALSHQQKRFGQSHPLFINGHSVSSTNGHFPDVAPSDTRLVLGKFQLGTREHARRAITAAKEALTVWNDLTWQNRISFLRKAAELMTPLQFSLGIVHRDGHRGAARRKHNRFQTGQRHAVCRLAPL